MGRTSSTYEKDEKFIWSDNLRHSKLLSKRSVLHGIIGMVDLSLFNEIWRETIYFWKNAFGNWVHANPSNPDIASLICINFHIRQIEFISEPTLCVILWYIGTRVGSWLTSQEACAKQKSRLSLNSASRSSRVWHVYFYFNVIIFYTFILHEQHSTHNVIQYLVVIGETINFRRRVRVHTPLIHEGH
jgi:hypothetical protein